MMSRNPADESDVCSPPHPWPLSLVGERGTEVDGVPPLDEKLLAISCEPQIDLVAAESNQTVKEKPCYEKYHPGLDRRRGVHGNM